MGFSLFRFTWCRAYEQAGDLAGEVEGDPAVCLRRLEMQRDVHDGVGVGLERERIADPLEAADHGDRVRPAGSHLVGVELVAHGFVEVAENVLPAALGLSDEYRH